MDIEIELSLKIVGTEFAEADRMRKSVAGLGIGEELRHDLAYWASSQVTIGDRPIFHKRVNSAKAVKISGAIKNSHSSRKSRTPDFDCVKSH
jgi:hypothetical protein